MAQHGLATAQLLLTLGDTESRRRYLNARSTIEALLRLGVVPVVNENDTVATNEIRFGDNDRLSARVAVMASADELILLSDVDGLYTATRPRSRRGTARGGERDHARRSRPWPAAPAASPAPAAWSASSRPPGSRRAPAAR